MIIVVAGMVIVLVVVITLIAEVVIVLVVAVTGHLFRRDSGRDNASVYWQEVCLLRLEVIIFMILNMQTINDQNDQRIDGIDDIDLKTG